VTETDTAGTSTTRVFTGQTVSRNGSSTATASQTITIGIDEPHVMVCTTSPQRRANGTVGLFFNIQAGTWSSGVNDPASPLYHSTPAIYVQHYGTMCHLSDLAGYGGNPANYTRAGYPVNETGNPTPPGINATDWGAIYPYYTQPG